MNINVLTYNMSWATQINKSLGSEADFVKECQKLYKQGGLQCHKNAIKKIGLLKPLHLLGIQEVNSKVEPSIQKVQPLLKSYDRGEVTKSDGTIVTVSILYDPSIFGKVKHKYTFNLRNRKDPRPCLMILTTNNFLLINLHSPWETETLATTISKKLSMKNPIAKHINETTKIIVMGDFNDDKSLITKTKPLSIKTKKKTFRVKHILTKTQLQDKLQSCCWHEKGHQYGHFDSAGDYILTSKNIKQISMFIPKIFNKKKKKDIMFSDHKPVLSVIKI